MTTTRHPPHQRPRSGLAAAARRAAPWGFPIVYLGWAYLWWSPIPGSGTSVWAGRNLVLFLVGGASPLLAGICLAWLTGGAARVRDLAYRLADVRRVPARWWLVVLAFWLVFDLAMGGAALLLGVTDRPFDVAVDVLTDPATLAFQLTLAFVFPAVEEVGLRGYWLDRLQERYSVTTAGLINGATWAVWHAPFVAFPGYYTNTTFDPDLSWWLPLIMLDTLLFVWVYNGTDRSILAVLVFHGMMNLTGEVLGISPDMYPFIISGHALAAGVLVTSWRRQGPRMPSRQRRPDLDRRA